jgi:hypothetical protein
LKAIYTDIKARLEEIATLQYVALFNNQFVRSNNDNVAENTEQAFPYPCAFIHFFGDNEASSSGWGAKRLEVDIRVYIGLESYNLEPLEMFDLASEVQEKLQDWNTANFTSLQYIAQRMNYDHDNVVVYEFDFKTQYSDNTKYLKRNTITKNPPTSLDLTVDLDIDNNIIRTGNGA